MSGVKGTPGIKRPLKSCLLVLRSCSLSAMVRRVATQVHKQYARLARAGYFLQQPKEPAWYQAVLDHPPIPLPARASPSRTAYDSPPPQQDQFKLASKASKVKTPPIVYIEDEVRRQFFRDHPFEAFRERSLVESGRIEDEHPIRGEAWVRLSQRGRNPSAEEYIFFIFCELKLIVCFPAPSALP